MIDEDRIAIKPDPAVGLGHDGRVLFRETVKDPYVNVLRTYSPDEALRIGRALVEVALDMGATVT
jgi:hypothetical protein